MDENTKKWTNVSLLTKVVDQIKPLIETGDYASVAAFVDRATRLLLEKEAIKP